jgi:hypothetical protein
MVGIWQRVTRSLEQLGEAGRIQVRPGSTSGAVHRRGERQSPGVGVKHRHDRQQDVPLADAKNRETAIV